MTSRRHKRTRFSPPCPRSARAGRFEHPTIRRSATLRVLYTRRNGGGAKGSRRRMAAVRSRRSDRSARAAPATRGRGRTAGGAGQGWHPRRRLHAIRLRLDRSGEPRLRARFHAIPLADPIVVVERRVGARLRCVGRRRAGRHAGHARGEVRRVQERRYRVVARARLPGSQDRRRDAFSGAVFRVRPSRT